jgi:aspartate aminotransferase
VLPQEEFTAIVRMAAERGIWVIADECYVYLDYSGRRFSAGSVTESKERIVVIGSLSKTYAMTGWRLGYALAPKDVVSAMQKLQSQSTSNPTSIVQKAAVGALNGPQDCIKDMVEEYIRLRDRMVGGLRAIPGIQCNVPNGAFYAFANVSWFYGRKGINSASDVAGRLLREAQVVTVPGEAFGSTQHIRISYPTSPGEIDRGLERMRKFFEVL